jgi:hypothetical protein
LKSKIPLIFHFNQDLVEFSALASRVCYRGLLRTLLESPVRANIHISGTLVQALNWLDPEPLDLIRAGLASGQFELMGSTHSQNILIASDPWDNALQIRLHRGILEETFGVAPTAFWNPERCWSQPLVSVLAEAGYDTVTVEDHILDRSGGSERAVYETAYAGRSIRVVRDDERFKHLFNFAAWFGKPDRVHRYLDGIAAETADGEAVFAYAEDAEAMGLWGYAVDVVPEQTWDRLADLLDQLAAREDVELVRFRDLPEPVRTLSDIVDGSAAWMDASLRQKDRPYHEDGFADWFHFIDTSPKLRQTRGQYTAIREELQESPAEGPLVDLAQHVFLTHQYEFGCIGIGGPMTRVWNGAIAAISLLRMANSEPGVVAEDWNGDRKEEVLIREGDQAVVLSRSRAHVLYWADLKTGRLIVGNPSSVVPGLFVNEAHPPAPLKYPWSDLQDALDYAQFDRPVSPPTPMGKYLPDWIWEPRDGELTLALLGDRIMNETRETLTAQQGAFLDEILCDGEEVDRDSDFERSGLTFTARGDDSLKLVKAFAIHPDGLEMNYRINGRTDGPVELRIKAEIAGDYAENLHSGRAALAFLDEGGEIGVQTASGERIRMIASHPGARFSRRESLHALTLTCTISLDRLADEPVEFSLRLLRDHEKKP